MSGQPVACPTCQGVIVVPAFPPDGAYADPAAAYPPDYAPPPPPPPPPTSGPSSSSLGNDPVPLGCPHCGGMFQVLPSMAGQQVSCPHCQGVIVVPGFGGSPPGMAPPDFPPPGMQPPEFPPPGMQPPEMQPPGMQPPGMQPPGVQPPGMMPPSPQPQGPPDVGSAGPPPPPSSTPAGSRPKVVAKPAEGPVNAAEQRTKTVGRGREKIELRRLTPAELTARRRTRNLVMGAVFILLLGAIFIVLLNME